MNQSTTPPARRPTRKIAAGVLALWILGAGAMAFALRPTPEPEDALLVVVRDARVSGNAAAYRAGLADLQRTSPPHAALERLRLSRAKRAELGVTGIDDVADYRLALTNAETRGAARLLRAGQLIRGNERQQAIGAEMLRRLSADGNSEAVVLLADHLFDSDQPVDAELIALYRSAAFRDSEAADRMARLLSENPGLSVSPYEARDMRVLSLRLLEREAAGGQVRSMLALAERLSGNSAPRADVLRAERLYLRAMQAGSLEAMVRLAVLIRDPASPGHDLARSRELLEQAAARGSVSAAYQIAEAWRLGIGLSPDPVRAVSLYRQAAAGGNSSSMFRLGEMLTKGQGVAVDPAAGLGWYARAADAGHVLALQRLGLAYVEGRGVPRDVPRGLGLVERAAAQKNTGSMAWLAKVYSSSDIVEKDVGRSQRWAVRAVTAGSTDSSVSIIAAQALASGALGKSDLGRAEDILRGAIARGSMSAQLQLGSLLLSVGGARNEREGLALFEDAARRGHSGALAALGALYASGNGVPVDAARSRLYYTVAADMGDPSGYRGLGVAYATGFGVQRDMARAETLYGQAVAKGDIRSMMLLATCLLDGCAGAADRGRAIGLINQAAALGDSDANYQYALLILSGAAPGGTADIAQHLIIASRNGYPPARRKLLELGLTDPRTDARLAAIRDEEEVAEVPGA